MGFFSGKNTGVSCHFLSQGDLPNLGIELMTLASQADSVTTEPLVKLTLFFGRA